MTEGTLGKAYNRGWLGNKSRDGSNGSLIETYEPEVQTDQGMIRMNNKEFKRFMD
jgi:hypothetical protein